jgi:hypothetical protein
MAFRIQALADLAREGRASAVELGREQHLGDHARGKVDAVADHASQIGLQLLRQVGHGLGRVRVVDPLQRKAACARDSGPDVEIERDHEVDRRLLFEKGVVSQAHRFAQADQHLVDLRQAGQGIVE